MSALTLKELLELASLTPGCNCDTCRAIRRKVTALLAMRP